MTYTFRILQHIESVPKHNLPVNLIPGFWGSGFAPFTEIGYLDTSFATKLEAAQYYHDRYPHLRHLRFFTRADRTSYDNDKDLANSDYDYCDSGYKFILVKHAPGDISAPIRLTPHLRFLIWITSVCSSQTLISHKRLNDYVWGKKNRSVSSSNLVLKFMDLYMEEDEPNFSKLLYHLLFPRYTRSNIIEAYRWSRSERTVSYYSHAAMPQNDEEFNFFFNMQLYTEMMFNWSTFFLDLKRAYVRAFVTQRPHALKKFPENKTEAGDKDNFSHLRCLVKWFRQYPGLCKQIGTHILRYMDVPSYIGDPDPDQIRDRKAQFTKILKRSHDIQNIKRRIEKLTGVKKHAKLSKQEEAELRYLKEKVASSGFFSISDSGILSWEKNS